MEVIVLLNGFVWQLSAGTLSTGAYIGIAAAALVVVLVLLLVFLLPHSLVLLCGGGKYSREKVSFRREVKLPQPEREGFVFGGWYKDSLFTKPVGEHFRMPARGVTLYSKWVAKKQEPKSAQVPEKIPAHTAGTLTAESANAQAALKESEKVQEAPLPEEAALPVSDTKSMEDAEIREISATESDGREESFEEPSEPQEDISTQSAEEEEQEDENEVGEGDEVDNALVTLVSGAKVFVQYRRSFRARLIQADDSTKAMYNTFRNEVLSYIGVKERVSWNYDSFNVGRKQFVKINANAKSLIVYFALAPSEIEEKYNFRDVSEKKRYAAVPVRFKITGSRSLQYAIELLEKAAGEFGLDFKRVADDLVIPYESREQLIRERLIKVYAKRETGETVSEEQLEEYIAEGAEVKSLSAYTVTDEVAAGEAEGLISDATAKQLMLLADTKAVNAASGKRTYINLDTVSANFHEGDRVDLEALKTRGLIDKKAASCKVLARGKLDKALTIEAADFSLAAVKMIVLTGGKVVRLKKE